MAKYDSLITYLKGREDHVFRLSFAEVERILGDSLPESARKYAAWWSNSPVDPTHSWAREWVASGWRAYPKFADSSVEFRRDLGITAHDLKPKTHSYIMDLVREAGIDVTDWEFNPDGQPVKNPRANPNYCYNWSFGDTKSGYVVCVWHASLRDEKGHVVYRSDTGTTLKKLQDRLYKASTTQEQKSRLTQQIRRAQNFIEAVSFSFLSQRPLRLILNLGDMRREEDIGNAASAVELRALDDEEWFVHELVDGDALIVRGMRPNTVSVHEAGMDAPPEDPGQDDIWREGQVSRRRGQPEFRAKLLEAYQRRCAVTGCILEPVLEAAHIIPHSEATDYRTANGLLLRSDIHTLYDLHHLSIDGRGKIHLSRHARTTEYRQYEGRDIRMPALALSPSPSNLDSRHARFLAKESERL
jgi:hypothetical protein